MRDTLAVILAGGKGTRMESDLPKVLFPVLGKPMIEYVLNTLEASGVTKTVVVTGYKSDDVRQALGDRANMDFVLQEPQHGTGHAVQMAIPHIEKHDGPVVVLAGDSPMAQSSSLCELLETFHRDQPACLLGTLYKDDPTGLGRIVRENGEFIGIVEEKDATDEQRKITEVNMSTYIFEASELLFALTRLTNDNKQQEYYLTDCPGILKAAGKPVAAAAALKPCEALSINTLTDLQLVEGEMRKMVGCVSGAT